MRLIAASLLLGCLVLADTESRAGVGAPLPEVAAENLNKVKVVLPRDFTAERNVMMFSFGQDMQAAVDAWDAALSPNRDGVAVQVYNTPLIPNPGAIVRGFISGGMRGVYKDKAIRERVVVLYVNEDKYFPALGVTDKTAPLLVVMDKTGTEIGRVQSVLNDQALAEVRSLIDNKSD